MHKSYGYRLGVDRERQIDLAMRTIYVSDETRVKASRYLYVPLAGAVRLSPFTSFEHDSTVDFSNSCSTDATIRCQHRRSDTSECIVRV